jgi:hypothetical protein
MPETKQDTDATQDQCVNPPTEELDLSVVALALVHYAEELGRFGVFIITMLPSYS